MKTREKIIQTALQLFNEKGLSQVGVREIARALDISVGNLSYHFPKKEDIVLELFERIRSTNEGHYAAYFAGPPQLDRFLACFRAIFHNQYRHRGVFMGNDEANRILQSQFGYAAVEQRRRDFMTRIFSELHTAGELSLQADELTFLVSFMTLFGRFWMMEAFVSFRDRPVEEIIDHYLGLLRFQLGLFATETGRRRLAKGGERSA
ncbi:MAG: TetR/AcrR family transcriptional regulator [Lewinella sp.]|nr:TetR/AcrR family transcriptional regulator [Lewinella sp.]